MTNFLSFKLGPFAAFSFGPTIKFSLNWSTTSPINIVPAYKTLNEYYLEQHIPSSLVLAADTTTKDSTDVVAKRMKEELHPKLYFQFLYCNSTRQQTEAREGTSCPWCDLQCWSIYGLLRHLTCNHNRFHFVYTVSCFLLHFLYLSFVLC